ncbi:hypothetical protein SEA_ZUKO_44 [Streptomyces phage Zuko]|uniref:Uncharacterized protein n=1 Tax=Streptomyces phage Zuko TaxID=2601695 RepID=A0A5J6D6W5_9CAUD|nr:hypothetical protein PP630_gp044 [Streptomyces phage Zuko]QEQ93622.1 hypothetical protein SEA_ZUKO_44 [Streptomyces phage Zuko]
MSKLLRCNRCGQEQEIREVVQEDNPLTRMATAMSAVSELKSWTFLRLTTMGFPLKPPVKSFDLCEDCREVFTEQFMVGAEVAAITQPPGQHKMPHDDILYQDCLLAFDPERGGLICEHDDPERFLWLQRNRAQNVAEGVPEQEAVPTIGDWANAIRDPEHPLRPTLEENRQKLQSRVEQMVEDVATAGVAHAVPQRCSPACAEMHTYVEGCLLQAVVTNVPGQIMPPACGTECDPGAGRHTNKLGTCLNNPDTARAIVVVCPVCKVEGSLAGIVQHMAEHGYQPDYPNAQWVDERGYNLDGRLISQQGEDLTEAYSEQDPVREGE